MESATAAVLGCGTISGAYLEADDRFDSYDIVGCADIDSERAKETAKQYDIAVYDPVDLLTDEAIDIVINLTPPSVHAETCLDLLDAGKHVYVEKPLAVTTGDAEAILKAAKANGVFVGTAPDTVLGAGLQTCRSVVESGRIGDPVGATAVLVSGGPESWHPNPDLFYREGGGPLFDMGPYYVTALVSVFGSASRVTGSVARAFDERTITSEPRNGEAIDVEVPTHETGIIDFADGPIASVLTSFDVPGGSSLPAPTFEIYGTEGTLKLPDPNQFKGPVAVREAGDEMFEEIPLTHRYTDGRGAGVADLARAIQGDWNHRTNSAVAAHVLEILEGIRTSSETGEHVDLESDIDRPKPLPPTFPEDVDP